MSENRKRKFWGWGYEDQGPKPEQQQHMAERMAKRFDLGGFEITPPPTRERPEAARAASEAARSARVDLLDRRPTIARVTVTARSFRDIVRAFRRDYPESVRRGRLSAR